MKGELGGICRPNVPFVLFFLELSDKLWLKTTLAGTRFWAGNAREQVTATAQNHQLHLKAGTTTVTLTVN